MRTWIVMVCVVSLGCGGSSPEPAAVEDESSGGASEDGSGESGTSSDAPSEESGSTGEPEQWPPECFDPPHGEPTCSIVDLVADTPCSEGLDWIAGQVRVLLIQGRTDPLGVVATWLDECREWPGEGPRLTAAAVVDESDGKVAFPVDLDRRVEWQWTHDSGATWRCVDPGQGAEGDETMIAGEQRRISVHISMPIVCGSGDGAYLSCSDALSDPSTTEHEPACCLESGVAPDGLGVEYVSVPCE